MTAWWIAATATVLSVALVGWLVWRRVGYYRSLAATLARTLTGSESQVDELSAHPAPDFSHKIAYVAAFLPEKQLTALRAEVERFAAAKRSYVPTHKKGGTIAYAMIIEQAPTVTRLYHSHALQHYISRIIGAKVHPTPLHDQSSLSILIYERPGDHIDWHYDHNFYLGRHFTVLLPVINAGHGEGGLSHAQLSAKLAGQDVKLATPPNTLVVFEGAKVLHKASPIEPGERRVVISMTFCTDPRATVAQAIARRVKDTAFFGVRALWT
jgi:hypothetical protein